MLVPHNAAVLVADGRKLLFLRNEGDGQNLNLVVEHAEEQAGPADRDIKTDAPGRAAGVDARRSAMGEADFHQIDENRFAADAAALLKQRALAGAFESLIVVAPPRTLGELRKHYHGEVASRLVGEIDKDFTGHPISDIETALQRA